MPSAFISWNSSVQILTSENKGNNFPISFHESHGKRTFHSDAARPVVHAVRQVDCWAVGSLLYQLVLGKPPFPPPQNMPPQNLCPNQRVCGLVAHNAGYQAVLEREEVYYPRKMNAELQDLLRRPDPRKPREKSCIKA